MKRTMSSISLRHRHFSTNVLPSSGQIQYVGIAATKKQPFSITVAFSFHVLVFHRRNDNVLWRMSSWRHQTGRRLRLQSARLFTARHSWRHQPLFNTYSASTSMRTFLEMVFTNVGLLKKSLSSSACRCFTTFVNCISPHILRQLMACFVTYLSSNSIYRR